MPHVYRRRPEFVVAEEAPAGGTVTTRNGITPVAVGDMMVHTGGEQQLVRAADFSQQFEEVAYEDTPEHLREIVDPERVQREREAAAKKEEQTEHRAAARAPAGKTTKTSGSRGRSADRRQDASHSSAADHRRDAEHRQDAAAHQRNEERRAEHDAAQAHLQDEGDFGPQPTPEAQITHGA